MNFTTILTALSLFHQESQIKPHKMAGLFDLTAIFTVIRKEPTDCYKVDEGYQRNKLDKATTRA